MRCYILLLILLATATTSFAQSNFTISIGEKGRQYELTKQPITERLSAFVVKGDPKLVLTAKDDNYKIAQYDVSILKDNKVIGPFTVGENNAQDVFDKLYSHFEPGAKVFYEKIMLVSRNPPNRMAHPGIVVELQ